MRKTGRTLLAGALVGCVAGLAVIAAFRRPGENPAPSDAWAGSARVFATVAVYGSSGARLVPQDGLVPLGPDPDTDLLEFAMPATGTVPRRDESGRLVPDPGAAVVLVLLPGGRYLRGAQPDPDRPGFDAAARDFERPVAEVGVAPFFLAKHEMTAGQWARLVGESPPIAPRLPRVDLSFDAASAGLATVGLRLPSEAEWEYACRAGTTSRYWAGDGEDDLARVGWYRANSSEVVAWLETPDGVLHVVGEKPASAFGLHDVHGNVAEWCEDLWSHSHRGAPTDGSARLDAATHGRVIRGGSWFHDADHARSSARAVETPGRVRPWLGVRPARTAVLAD